MGSLLATANGESSEPSAAADSEEVQAVEMFKAQFESFLRRLEAEWTTERDSGPYSVDDGKYILQNALSQVLDFRAQIVRDEGSQLSGLLEDASKRLKSLQRHRIYADGGNSFRAFWKQGDEVIELLKKVPSELDKVISSQNVQGG